MSEWWRGGIEVKDVPMVAVYETWTCPVGDCGGEMKFNGMVWMCDPEGNHHTCNKCGTTLVISGARYPRVAHKRATT